MLASSGQNMASLWQRGRRSWMRIIETSWLVIGYLLNQYINYGQATRHDTKRTAGSAGSANTSGSTAAE